MQDLAAGSERARVKPSSRGYIYLCFLRGKKFVEVKTGTRNASRVKWIITLKRVDRLLAVIDEAQVLRVARKQDVNENGVCLHPFLQFSFLDILRRWFNVGLDKKFQIFFYLFFWETLIMIDRIGIFENYKYCVYGGN